MRNIQLIGHTILNASSCSGQGNFWRNNGSSVLQRFVEVVTEVTIVMAWVKPSINVSQRRSTLSCLAICWAMATLSLAIDISKLNHHVEVQEFKNHAYPERRRKRQTSLYKVEWQDLRLLIFTPLNKSQPSIHPLTHYQQQQQ